MRLRQLLLGCFTTLLAVAACADPSNWHDATLPDGIEPYDLVVHEGDFYTITEEGVVRSRNNGRDWEILDKGLPNTLNAEWVQTIGNTTYASSDHQPLLKSTDSGRSWTEARLELPDDDDTDIDHIFVIDEVPDSLFAVQFGSFLFESHDNGMSWSEIELPDDFDAMGFAVIGGRIFVVNSFDLDVDDERYHEQFTFSEELYASGDFGKTWERVSGGPPLAESLGLIESRREIALMVVGQVVDNDRWLECVFLSVDSGETWRSLSETCGQWSSSSTIPEKNQPILDIAIIDKALFYLTSEQVFRSDDLGKNWINTTGNLPGCPESAKAIIKSCFAELAAVKDRLFVSTHVGLFVSHDWGDTWKPSQSGLPIVGISTVYDGPGDVIFANNGAEGLYRSSDFGKTWVEVAPTEGAPHSRLCCLRESSLGLTIRVQDQIYRLSPDTEEWTPVNIAGADLRDLYFEAVGPDIVAVGTRHSGDKVYRFNNDSGMWEAYDEPSDRYIMYTAAVGKYVFLSYGEWEESFRSVDFGKTWEDIGGGFHGFAVVDDTIFISNLYGFYRSDDQGKTWVEVTPEQFIWAEMIFSPVPGYLFMGDRDAMYMSRDCGATWVTYDVEYRAELLETLLRGQSEKICKADSE